MAGIRQWTGAMHAQQFLLPNGRPLRIRLDGGPALSLTEQRREEQVSLMETAAPPPATKDTYVAAAPAKGTVCVLATAIGIFVVLSLGIIVIVVVLWVEIGKLADINQSDDLPTLKEVGTFAREVMNATASTLRGVEQMTAAAQVMLGQGFNTVRNGLNTTDHLLHKATQLVDHPPELKIGVG